MDTEIYSVYEVPIPQLLKAPQDESNIDECWEAPLYPSIYMNGTNLTHNAAPVTPTEREEVCTAASMLHIRAPLGPPTYMMEPNLTRNEAPVAMLPVTGWMRKRGSRKRRIPLCTDRRWFLGNHFGEKSCLWDAPSVIEGQECARRTNNSRWTPEEVKILLDGVEEFGDHQWSALKKKWFPASVRTATNLKDKWRNLLKAYTGNAQRRTYLQLDEKDIKRIQKLASQMKVH